MDKGMYGWTKLSAEEVEQRMVELNRKYAAGPTAKVEQTGNVYVATNTTGGYDFTYKGNEFVSEKKIKVPEEMVREAVVAYNAETTKHGYKYVVDRYVIEAAVTAALRWLSENPIQPTPEQFHKLYEETYGDVQRLVEWQRRMFLAPDPPPEIDDLRAWPNPAFQGDVYRMWGDEEIKLRLEEAFRRGKESK